MTTTTATITRWNEYLQTTEAANGNPMFRYRCSTCGSKGRWVKNGADAMGHYNQHEMMGRCR
jgi:hypothetical protein